MGMSRMPFSFLTWCGGCSYVYLSMVWKRGAILLYFYFSEHAKKKRGKLTRKKKATKPQLASSCYIYADGLLNGLFLELEMMRGFPIDNALRNRARSARKERRKTRW